MRTMINSTGTKRSKNSIIIKKKSLLFATSLSVVLVILLLLGNKWRGQILDYKKQVSYSELRNRELEQKVKELSQTQESSQSSKFLEIKELGIKLSLNSKNDDLYYVVEEIPSESTPQLIHISTRKAQQINDNCSAENGGLMTISMSDRTSYDQQVENGTSNVRKIGEKYIRIENALGVCDESNNDEVARIVDSLYSTDILPL